MCVLEVNEVKEILLEEAHKSRFIVHPGSTTMC